MSFISEVSLTVTPSGQTQFEFKGGESIGNSLSLTRIPNKGVGIESLRPLQQYEVLLRPFNVLHVASGKKRMFLCTNCCSISKKMKVHSSCSSLCFCSELCMDQWVPFLAAYGCTVDFLFDKVKETPDLGTSLLELQLLVLQVLHRDGLESSSTTLPYRPLEQALCSLSCSGVEDPGLLAASRALVEARPASLRPSTDDRADGESAAVARVRLLMLALSLNSFQIPVLSVPDTFITVAHPVFARLNHSCSPNCTLSVGVGAGAATPGLHVDLMTTTAVEAGEELSICYIANTCLSVEARRALLQSVFCFECACPRCHSESLSTGSPGSLNVCPSVKPVAVGGVPEVFREIGMLAASLVDATSSPAAIEANRLSWWRSRHVLKVVESLVQCDEWMSCYSGSSGSGSSGSGSSGSGSSGSGSGSGSSSGHYLALSSSLSSGLYGAVSLASDLLVLCKQKEFVSSTIKRQQQSRGQIEVLRCVVAVDCCGVISRAMLFTGCELQAHRLDVLLQGLAVGLELVQCCMGPQAVAVCVCAEHRCIQSRCKSILRAVAAAGAMGAAAVHVLAVLHADSLVNGCVKLPLPHVRDVQRKVEAMMKEVARFTHC